MLKNFRKKFIGDKAFYMMVLGIAVPIMIQNGITNFVNLLDNIMVGRLGTEQMSGVSIVNQLMFVITSVFLVEYLVREYLRHNILGKKMMKEFVILFDLSCG